MLRGGEGGVAGRHVARGQFDGGAAERVHYSTLYGGSDLRVSFAKSSHVVELHFLFIFSGGGIRSDYRGRTLPKLNPLLTADGLPPTRAS